MIPLHVKHLIPLPTLFNFHFLQTANPRFFVVPRGMEKIINYVKERYNSMRMIVTENGK